MTPHLIPQLLVGLILLFPHAILHEASITFLGFGLSPEQPAIGVILSESMKYLAMGRWWLALFPGLLLVLVVLMFHVLGDNLSRLIDPKPVSYTHLDVYKRQTFRCFLILVSSKTSRAWDAVRFRRSTIFFPL